MKYRATYWLAVMAGFLIGMPMAGKTNDAQINSGGVQRATVFWNGVNGCQPSNNPKYDYKWQEHAEGLHASDDHAEPFGLMARDARESGFLDLDQISADLDAYLKDCREQGKIPFVVLTPDLNIQGYIATLSPIKDNLLTSHAEATVLYDINWTKRVTPLILSKLSEYGYDVDGFAHSAGGPGAAEGIIAAKDVIRAENINLMSLTFMNARVPVSKITEIENKGLVNEVRRITTAGDAFANPWSAAYGKADVIIRHVGDPTLTAGRDASLLSIFNASLSWFMPAIPRIDRIITDWITRHDVPLGADDTRVIVEVDGVRVVSDLGSVRRGEIVMGAQAKTETTENNPTHGSHIAINDDMRESDFEIPEPRPRESDFEIPEPRRRQSVWRMPEQRR